MARRPTRRRSRRSSRVRTAGPGRAPRGSAAFGADRLQRLGGLAAEAAGQRTFEDVVELRVDGLPPALDQSAETHGHGGPIDLAFCTVGDAAADVGTATGARHRAAV